MEPADAALTLVGEARIKPGFVAKTASSAPYVGFLFRCYSNPFTGTLATLTLKAKVKIVRVPKDSEKAPDARVYAGTTELGAAWSKTSREDRSYMSVKLDDPSFSGPIFANLVESEEGAFSLIWSR